MGHIKTKGPLCELQVSIWTHHPSYRNICPLPHIHGHFVSSLPFGPTAMANPQAWDSNENSKLKIGFQAC